MKNKNRYFTVIALLLFFLLCLVPSGQAQAPACIPVSQGMAPSWILGLKCTFTSASTPYGPIIANGIGYWQVFAVPTGTVSAATLSIDSSGTGIGGSWSIGGVLASGTIGSLASATLYANSIATTPTNFAQLTATVTGSGTVTLTLFGYTNNPAAAGGGGGGSVTVTNFPVTQPVSLATAPTTPTQPLGFGTLIGFQQAVTASAVALTSTASHAFCVTALATNTINVFVGPSGVTTSTGLPLLPGQTACWSLSNTNLAFVIASSTGASVAVTGV